MYICAYTNTVKCVYVGTFMYIFVRQYLQVVSWAYLCSNSTYQYFITGLFQLIASLSFVLRCWRKIKFFCLIWCLYWISKQKIFYAPAERVTCSKNWCNASISSGSSCFASKTGSQKWWARRSTADIFKKGMIRSFYHHVLLTFKYFFQWRFHIVPLPFPASFSVLVYFGFSSVSSRINTYNIFGFLSFDCTFSSPLDALPVGVAVRCWNETNLRPCSELRIAEILPSFGMDYTAFMHPIVMTIYAIALL